LADQITKKNSSITKTIVHLKALQSVVDILDVKISKMIPDDKGFVFLFALVFASSSVILTISTREWMQHSDNYLTQNDEILKRACEDYKIILDKEKPRMARLKSLFDASLRSFVQTENQEQKQTERISLLQRFSRYIVEKMKQQAVSRTFNFLSFFSVNFFITLFGSKLGPVIATRIANKKTVKQIIIKLLRSDPKKQDIEFAGFILGSILGASMSTLPYFLVEFMRIKAQHRFLGNENEDEVKFTKDVFLTQNFYLMVGALLGIFLNLAARHGANAALTIVLQKFVTSQFGSKDPSTEALTKMLINNVMKTYSSFASSLLRPALPSTQSNKSEASTTQFKDMIMRMASSQLMEKQVPLNNPIVKNVMEWYWGTSQSSEEKPTGIVNQTIAKVKRVKSTYDNTWKKVEQITNPYIEKVYPSVNATWHGWSTQWAKYFAKKYAVPFFHKTDQKLLEKVKRVLDGTSMRSRL
jgi:hypothetical protein